MRSSGGGWDRDHRDTHAYRGAPGPHRNASDNTWSESVSIPIDLLDWAASTSNREAIEALLTSKVSGLLGVEYTRIRQSEARFDLLGGSMTDVRVAAGILQLRLSHQEELQKVTRRAELASADLRAAEEELSSGMRVEFSVPYELLGLVIGKQGANLKKVQDASGVTRINVADDASPPMIHVRGPTAESVAEARRMLEYVSHELDLTSEQADWVYGADGATLRDIKEKSRVARFEINAVVAATAPRVSGAPHYTHKLTLIGLKSDVELAQALIDAQIEYQLEYRALAAGEEEARAKLRAMDMCFEGGGRRGGAGGRDGGGGGHRGVQQDDGGDYSRARPQRAEYRSDRGGGGAAPAAASGGRIGGGAAGGAPRGSGFAAPPPPPAAAAAAAQRNAAPVRPAPAAARALPAAAAAADADLDRAGGAGRRRHHDEDDDDIPVVPLTAGQGGGGGRGANRGGGRR